MKPFELVSHKGRQIAIVDIAGTQPAAAMVALREAAKHISSQQPKSLLLLTDVTKAVYTVDSYGAMREFASKNTPFVKASAVVGADGIMAALQKTIEIATKRNNIKACKNRNEAMDWLVSQ